MIMTQQLNEAFVRAILENSSREDAIVAIAKAITNRDEKIKNNG
jgi:hypothetical protein